MNKKYKVSPTQNVNRQGEYMVQINLDHVSSQFKSDYLLLESEKGISIQARYGHDGGLDRETVCVDQTLRYALGIDTEDYLHVKPMTGGNKPGIIQSLIRSVLGTQVNIVRVHQSSFNDMEINLCRLSHESLQSINAVDGDVIIVESPHEHIKIRAVEMTPKIINELKERTEKDDQKYKDCAKFLGMETVDGVSFDLWPILLDLDARLKLGINECDPVRIYRSLGNDAGKRIHLISVPLILSLIAALISFEFSFVFKVGILFFGVIVILLLNFVGMKIK